MLLVGLTGGIASGKSTVSRLLAERGAVIVDADEIARRAVEPGTPAWSKIVEHFGSEVLLPDKRINRPLLGRIVFEDQTKRALLNEIVHPVVMREMAERLEELRPSEAIVVCDVPLLVEVGSADAFDLVVVVSSGLEEQIDRMKRDRGMDRREALSRIEAQAPLQDKQSVADIVVENNGSIADLEGDVAALWDELTRRRVLKQA